MTMASKLIESLLRRVRDCKSYLDSGDAVKEHLAPRDGDIMAQQRGQLLEGKRPDGWDIRPYYSEDPYFTVLGMWGGNPDAYKAWKRTLPNWDNPKRNPDAPNLYINGRFHSELGAYFEADGITIMGTTSYALGIVRKYGNDTFGLSDGRWAALMEEVLPDIKKSIREILDV